MTGERASAVFGATLWWHPYLPNCRNELLWRQACSSQEPVTHSSGDPPFRGAEKTTRVGSPPVTRCLQEGGVFPTLLCLDSLIEGKDSAVVMEGNPLPSFHKASGVGGSVVVCCQGKARVLEVIN